MVDFTHGISDRAAGERLSRSLQGKGAFRRFKNELYQGHPDLIAAWHALRGARARAPSRCSGWPARSSSKRTLPNGSREITRTPAFTDHCSESSLADAPRMSESHRRESGWHTQPCMDWQGVRCCRDSGGSTCRWRPGSPFLTLSEARLSPSGPASPLLTA